MKPILNSHYKFYSSLILNFFICIILLPFSLRAQQSNVIVKGHVIDKNGTPISYASIAVFKSTTRIKGIICDSLGKFSTSLLVGKYGISVTGLGFQEYKNTITIMKSDSLNIVLQRKTNQLGEVVVTAQKTLIEHKIDRIVFNVENSILSTGVNAIDVLRETPRIEVTDNGYIKMTGKSTLRVMIDGRIQNLSDEDVKNKLSALRSDDIARIEIIAIPPSKYSAGGNSGLINIILKKSALLGWKGSVNSTYIQRIYASTSQSGNINYQSKRLEASIGISNNPTKNVNEENTLYNFTDNSLNTSRYSVYKNNALSFNGILKYKLNDKMEIGGTFNYSRTNRTSNYTASNNYINKPNNGIDSIVNSTSLFIEKPRATAASAYYDYNIDTKGKKMEITYNYSLNTNLSTNNISSIISSNLAERNNGILNDADNNYRINSIMADFELPFHFAKIETGGAYTSINNQTALKLFDNNISNQLTLDTSGTNNFEYTEKTSALYISAEKEFNKKWSAKVGLRYEYTSLQGYSPTLNLTTDTSYGRLFPTAYLLYNDDKKNTISFAYSERIERPGFNDLNPFRYYSGVYSYTSGNAYLLPSFSHNVEISYTYNNNLSIILSGSRLLNGMGYVSLFSNGINYQVPENYFNENRVGLDISYTYKPFNWWSIYSSGNINYNQSKSYVPSLEVPNTEGYGASARTRSTFTLNKKKTTFFSISYNQFLPSKDGFQQTKAFGYMSANFRFITLNKKLSFLVSTLDIFKQDYTVTQMKYRNYNRMSTFNPKLQNVLISATYSFGNNKVKNVNKDSKNTTVQRAY